MADVPNLAPTYLGVFCSLTGLALILVCVRLWIRSTLIRRVGSDDWVVVLAMVCSALVHPNANRILTFRQVLVLGCLSCLGTACHYGLGRHKADLTHEQEINALKFLWVAFNITPAAEITAKISITLMLMKLTTSRAWRWLFISLIVINIGVTIASNFTFLLSCRPLQKLWDSTLEGTCDLLGRNIELYIQGITAAAYDVALAFAPIFLLWKVQIRARDKLMLCGLFALGCFTAAAGILRITFTDATTWSDGPTWTAMPFVLWKCVELPLSIVVGCLPTLRPLFNQEKHRARSSMRPRNNFSPFPGNQFAIKKTTDIYIRSSDAESARALGRDWEMITVVEASHQDQPRRIHDRERDELS